MIKGRREVQSSFPGAPWWQDRHGMEATDMPVGKGRNQEAQRVILLKRLHFDLTLG